MDPANAGLRPQHELNDAICALDRLGKRASADSYLPCHEALRASLAEHRQAIEQPCLQLAAIDDLRLFVTTTIDDVLAQVLDKIRHGGRSETEQVEYAPSGLSQTRRTDISEVESGARTAVVSLFGKAAVSPVFAVHDEDILEFLYGLQAGLGQPPRRFFSAIRGANLLLIGCQFPDWLSRFLIRVAAPQRLSEQRGRRDFVIDPSPKRTGLRAVPPDFRAEYANDLDAAEKVRRGTARSLEGRPPSDGPARRAHQFARGARPQAGGVHQLFVYGYRTGADPV